METTRREFILAGALGALGLGVTGPFEALAAPARRRTSSTEDTVVVFLNLIGGNDGLNTIVPLLQYARYRELRPSLGWEREQLIPLPGHEDVFALNGAMQPLADLFAQQKLAIINGCGTPLDTFGLFDHEQSQQNLQTGDAYATVSPVEPTGWLGRYLDTIAPGELPAGIDFSFAPLLLTGVTVQPLSVYTLDGFGFYPSDPSTAEERLRAYDRLQRAPAAAGVPSYSQTLRRQVREYGGVLRDLSDAYRVAAGVTYPATYLGSSLRDCAALIAANRGVRALGVRLSGFDTHAAQNEGSPDAPVNHSGLWAEVSASVAAFHADLKAHDIGERVVTLVCSEFGRRASENADLGTDHGIAAPMLVIGDRIKGGVYGEYPDLREEHLVLDSNLDVRVDFRSVYATVLAEHLGADPEPILRGKFPPVGFL